MADPKQYLSVGALRHHGEAATLTDEERFTVIQTVAKTAAGRVPVIAGAGCNDTARAEQNCLAAAAAGADALASSHPLLQ